VGTERRLRRARQNAESPTREYNFVDPDSRLMMDTARKAFAQAYHAQAAADEHAQVIVAAEVTQDTTDRAQLLPLVRCVGRRWQRSASHHRRCRLLGHVEFA
jgi:hypothetical protein